ncbi:MAG TPA: DNA polymerase IV [Acidimicrobiales bacterium]|nr:DNA polymerase IV [Acidimicrobiales bacterium]
MLDVLHVDMDAFFAAVEVLDDPTLLGLPVIVGGTGSRGVVASCSYEARATGVRSAMSMVEARRRCPQAVVLPGRHARYGEVSRELHKVFEVFTPLIEPIALDEAFLDVSGCHRLFGSSSAIAEAIRARVMDDLRLSCSVGVARCKLLAKLASRAAKPTASASGPVAGSGVYLVAPDDELTFLHPRPVSDLWGVGPRTAERLSRYGIATIGDLAKIEPAHLERLVGRAAGSQLHELAWARDDRPVVPGRPVKSVSHEETFGVDERDPERLRLEVVRMADAVSSRLRASGLAGRTVTVKLRYGDFTTITRSHSLRRPVASSAELVKIAAALLSGIEVHPGVRLLGVSVSSLEARAEGLSEQLTLWELVTTAGGQGRVASAARSDVDTAVDAIRERYGTASVGPAALAGGPRLRVKQLGDAPWGPSGDHLGERADNRGRAQPSSGSGR